ncbi:MAG: 2Fe-2S iron-sulfur cluster-binding protein [Pseudomonadales bacterium]|nr:2Fe-2S iron-sulfur cluster binding domain-containing protein [Pseudomonadales bacterium]
MPKIIYVEHNGTEHEVEVPVGTSLMQGAINHLVPGIEGDCGGLCACGTCHVYLTAESAALCGEPDELELGMLEFAFDVNDASRLSCQIPVTEDMDGMVVRMPSRQY